MILTLELEGQGHILINMLAQAGAHVKTNA